MLLMNKAIIWDLLGTLGGDSQTLINNSFKFFDQAVPALQKADENGFLNIIITNQCHIAHERMTLEKTILQMNQQHHPVGPFAFLNLLSR